jgi:multiple sugar transport system substrate-binding protein
MCWRWRGGGAVIFPGKAIDSLMHFWMLCVALGSPPAAQSGRLVDPAVGEAALLRLRALAERCPPACLDWNPIRVCEELAAGRTAAYCPFAYGYSNYARAGYAAHRLAFGPLVTLHGRRLRSTLARDRAGPFVRLPRAGVGRPFRRGRAASPEWQRTLYTWSGGQPGHRLAWLDEEANRLTNDYFRETLSTLEEAWLRPRYDGYLHLQDRGAEVLHQWLRAGGPAQPVLAELERLHAESRKGTVG